MEKNQSIQLIECPRDAMQGLKEFIPTEKKAKYIQSLLAIGFHSIDFGSFVSPKAIPQLKDTAEVLNQLDLSVTKTKLLAIVANRRGAEEAVNHANVHYLGYPLSVSETFQKRNTNRSITDALEDLAYIQELAVKHNKQLVTYLSMGFGNPYGDPYSPDFLGEFVEKLDKLAIGIISLADTVGLATTNEVEAAFSSLVPSYKGITFGAHLHASPHNAAAKANAAFIAGCRRFDSAIKGIGGCPMADDELIGNMDTEILINELKKQDIDLGINFARLHSSVLMANDVFPI